MGADLYIQGVDNEEEGYFRDSYNGTAIAWQLGFSWWSDIVPKLDEEGILPPAEVYALLCHCEDTTVPTITAQWLTDNHCTVDDDENSPEAWQKMFEDKRERFIAFLRRSLERELPLHCSL
jgi:hypothetical protein